ncbi:MAG TPA: hypothetical protein VMW54_02465 [Terriglobia bacterium]|nr:hypothetical protein [Terriglobia bacterium]
MMRKIRASVFNDLYLTIPYEGVIRFNFAVPAKYTPACRRGNRRSAIFILGSRKGTVPGRSRPLPAEKRFDI